MKQYDSRTAEAAHRGLELVVAIWLVVLFMPLLLLAAVAVRMRLGSPVLFRQRRPGRHGEPFTLVKFRTMTDATDRHGVLATDEQRLTGLGRTLRATGIDELPELWNVLRGDMSLVGPRPLLLEYLDRYTPAEARRHDVRPGITGWAQINGIRNTVPGTDPSEWDRRIAYDLWYVEHRSLRVDAHILAVTARQSWRRVFSLCR